MCYRLLGGHEADAEEAVGRVALALLNNRDMLGELQCARAWMYRVAHNACMDIHRERKRKSVLNLDADRERDPERYAPSPEDLYLQHEQVEQVRDALASLPEVWRTSLLMRVAEGLSYREMAARIPVSEDNLRKRVQLAREVLRAHLDRRKGRGREER